MLSPSIVHKLSVTLVFLIGSALHAQTGTSRQNTDTSINTDVSPFQSSNIPTTVDISGHDNHRPIAAISEDDDALLRLVKQTKRGFIVIGASNYLDPKDDRPFALAAAQTMTQVLTHLECQPLFQP